MAQAADTSRRIGRLPSPPQAGLHGAMPKSPGRKRPGARRAPARSRKSKRAQPARWRSGLRLAWELLPLFLLLFVALAAFVLDPAAVARLAWASVSGSFGAGVQVAGSVAILAGATAVIWAFWPDPADPRRRPAKPATASRRQSRQTTGRTRSAPAGTSPGEPASTAAEAAAPQPAASVGVRTEAASAEADPTADKPTQPRKPRRAPHKAGQRAPRGSGATNAAAE